jgi:hypothetical protein
MPTQHQLKRPINLVPGAKYLRRNPAWSGGDARYTPVTLLGYDACPVFVIVRSGDCRLRCPREELFVPEVYTDVFPLS